VWQELLQWCHHCTTTLLSFCLSCAGLGAVSPWLIVLIFIFINLGFLAAWQATAMPWPLMQLCCCMLLLAAQQHLLPMPLPQHHDVFPSSDHQEDACCFMSWSLGLLLGAAAVISNAAAWCCCCFLSPLLCHCHFHPPFLAHCHPLPSPLLSIAITIAVHCHCSHHP